MPTVAEVTINGSLLGQQHVNVFHVYDGNDSATPQTIAVSFDADYLAGMEPLCTTGMVWHDIVVKSLTAANPYEFIYPVTREGTNPDDPLPTGNHLFVKLNSGDIGFRAGGKLIGGWVESQFTGGEPSTGLLDGLQTVFDALITALPIAASVALAIYRPTLSVPGFPQISIVPTALVRGNSTNNRRRKDFERS